VPSLAGLCSWRWAAYPFPALTCRANEWRRFATLARCSATPSGLHALFRCFATQGLQECIPDCGIPQALRDRRHSRFIAEYGHISLAMVRAGGRSSPRKGMKFISPARQCRVTGPKRREFHGNDTMAHTYNANFVHCIFSTKDRENSIPRELQEQLWAYLLGIANNLKIKTLAVGGTKNHVHLLLGLPPTMTLAEAIQKLKANSSRWLGERGVRFQWQGGYGAFSVSPSLLGSVQAYIRNQEEHHRRRSFEDEFRVLLEKSGVTYDAERLFAA